MEIYTLDESRLLQCLRIFFRTTTLDICKFYVFVASKKEVLQNSYKLSKKVDSLSADSSFDWRSCFTWIESFSLHELLIETEVLEGNSRLDPIKSGWMSNFHAQQKTTNPQTIKCFQMLSSLLQWLSIGLTDYIPIQVEIIQHVRRMAIDWESASWRRLVSSLASEWHHLPQTTMDEMQTHFFTRTPFYHFQNKVEWNNMNILVC